MVVEDTERVQLVTLYTRVLLHLADNPRISQETLARRMDVTMRTVQRHLTELEEEGYVHVDRTKKPFEYRVDWSKSCPFIPWLRVAVFHPSVRSALAKMGEVAMDTYRTAEERGEDPVEKLSEVFAVRPREFAAP